jgi:hypothetical protein
MRTFFSLPTVGLLACLLGCQGNSVKIDKILATKDDFELCDQLCLRLVDHYGNDFDVSKCKENDQVVVLVWHASGIIDNGGFQYLFEGNFKGDPYFAKTAAAFKTIEAKKCAEAVNDALKLFPDSKPPTNVPQRLRAYQSVAASKRDAIDSTFFSESREIRKHLAKYIRDNSEAFKYLK